MLLRSDLNLTLTLNLITLRRIAQFDSRFNHLPHKPLSISNLHHHKMSAQQPKNNNDAPPPNPSPNPNPKNSSFNIAKSQDKQQKPPPEKPLPGDCCGSGCVRCVWDVYYEELEEFDRLYNPTAPKPS